MTGGNVHHTMKTPTVKNVVLSTTTKYHFTVKEGEILTALKDYNSLKLISKRIKRDRSNTQKTLLRLINKGYVEKEYADYSLTSRGLSALRGGRLDGVASSTTTIDSVEKKCRLHHFSAVLSFWNTPRNWEKHRLRVFGLGLVEDDKYFNHYSPEVGGIRVNPCFKHGGTASFKWGDHRIVCYANSVRVWLPEIVRESPEECGGEALRLLWDVAPRLERLLRVPRGCLFKDGRLNMRISTAHYALLGNVFARYAVRGKGVNSWVVSVDGVRRLLIDNSVKADGRRGLEFEAVSPLWGLEDIEKSKRFFEDLVRSDVLMPSEVTAHIQGLVKAFGVIAPVVESLGVGFGQLYNGGVRYYGKDS